LLSLQQQRQALSACLCYWRQPYCDNMADSPRFLSSKQECYRAASAVLLHRRRNLLTFDKGVPERIAERFAVKWCNLFRLFAD